jgi:hypothetical protein
MQIDKFLAWLETATPVVLERVEKTVDAGVRRAHARHSVARLENGRWHWMRREVNRKLGTRDYVMHLTADGYAVTTVYKQIQDWEATQNHSTLPEENLPDEVNPLEAQIKAAIQAAEAARVGRQRVPKIQLNGHVLIPVPKIYGTRDDTEIFRELRRTHDAQIMEIFLDAFHTALLIDQFIYEEDIDVDFSMQF